MSASPVSELDSFVEAWGCCFKPVARRTQLMLEDFPKTTTDCEMC